MSTDVPDINPDEHPDFREFVRWQSLPSWKRDDAGMPETQREWAEEHDYSARTLQLWKKTDAYQELMSEISDQWVQDAIPGVIETAKEVAQTPEPGGHNDRKMLLHLYGMGNEMTIKHEGEVEHTHTLEEVRTMDEGGLRKAMRAQLRQRPKFADRSDEELDALIEAFAGAHGGSGEALPSAGEKEIEDAETYVISEPSPDDDSTELESVD